MNKRHAIFGFCSLICVAAVLTWRSTDEVCFEGRSLSTWLAVCSREYRNPQKSEEYRVAEKAVREIGTNALPQLIAWLRDGTEPLEAKVDGVLVKTVLPGSQSNIETERPSGKRELAMAGFYALREKAAPVAPDLVAVMANTNSPNLSAAAAEALGLIGVEAMPSLLKALKGSSQQRHLALVERTGYLGNMGTAAAPVVPILVSDTRDGNWILAHAAVRALGNLAIEPGLSIPALTNSLTSHHASIRSQAIRSLARFGKAAQPVISLLIEAQNDRSAEVRVAATNAVIAIEQDAH